MPQKPNVMVATDFPSHLTARLRQPDAVVIDSHSKPIRRYREMAIKTLCITALVQENDVESLLAEAASGIQTRKFPMPLQNVKTFSPTGSSSDLRREIVLTVDVDGSEQDATQCAESIANFIDDIVGLQDAQWALAWT